MNWTPFFVSGKRVNMKKRLFFTLIVLLNAFLVESAGAIPRLQTCISGARYYSGYDGRFDGTWMTHRTSFQLDVVGAWDAGWRLRKRPTYDHMETYLIVGVPRGEKGELWINGTRLSSVDNDFNNVRPNGFRRGLGRLQRSVRGELDLHFYRLGVIDNLQRNATDFRPVGSVGEFVWGDTRSVDVVISGFSYTRFGAAGIDAAGFGHVNPHTRDSSFSAESVHAVPEPGTLGLLAAGLLGLAPWLRRRRRRD